MAHYNSFRGVGLEQARVDPRLMPLLKYNIRRKHWQNWYKNRRWLRWPILLFWWVSDYGRSIMRIVLTFFFLSFLFAAIYYHWGYHKPPGIIDNLYEVYSQEKQIPEQVPDLFVPARAIYFSIVTMTTLGFGDMYANAHNLWRHFLLIFQVLLGYILLGAIITRFAVLFTGVGPAGEFGDKEREKWKLKK